MVLRRYKCCRDGGAALQVAIGVRSLKESTIVCLNLVLWNIHLLRYQETRNHVRN
jgi:hypothetical protein